jgi:hypothetical protein
MSRNKSVKASQTATLTPRESLLKKSKPTIISSKIPFQTLSSGLVKQFQKLRPQAAQSSWSSFRLFFAN